jgi:fructosamine-3-kinase
VINWKQITTTISQATDTHFELAQAVPVTGGSINQTWRINDLNSNRYFIKLNDVSKLEMFAAESFGLNVLALTQTIRLPKVIAIGKTANHAFLVLEYIDLNNSGNARLLGERLAALHRCNADQFGFDQSNRIGETLQLNDWSTDWINFWREQRLGFQLELLASKGYGGNLLVLGQQLIERIPEYFDGYYPEASLLHGDLWSGNHAYSLNSEPVIFDPAPYYGDREAEIAMTELFGGFNQEFYAAYRAAWPLDAGYSTRKTLYNLYYILNHAVLFGGGYARQAEGMMQFLLK